MVSASTFLYNDTTNLFYETIYFDFKVIVGKNSLFLGRQLFSLSYNNLDGMEIPIFSLYLIVINSDNKRIV